MLKLIWCGLWHKRHWQRFLEDDLTGFHCSKCGATHYDARDYDWTEPSEETF